MVVLTVIVVVVVAGLVVLVGATILVDDDKDGVGFDSRFHLPIRLVGLAANVSVAAGVLAWGRSTAMRGA